MELSVFLEAPLPLHLHAGIPVIAEGDDSGCLTGIPRHHHPIGYREIPSVCYFDRQRMNVVLTAGKAGLSERISGKFLDALRAFKHPTCRRAMDGAIRR